MTRSKHESTATIKLVNLVTKRDSDFMAFSSGWGRFQPYSGGRTPFLLILFGCGSAALGRSFLGLLNKSLMLLPRWLLWLPLKTVSYFRLVCQTRSSDCLSQT